MSRLVLALLVAVLVVPLALAVPAPGWHPTSVQLVEGHTVYAALGAGPPPATTPGTLPPPHPLAASGEGGIRWLNDQDLVAADGGPRFAALAILAREENGRAPCTGAALVVSAGAPDPRILLASGQAAYARSYLVTDPNQRAFTTDVWEHPDGIILATALLGNEATRGIADDGWFRCAPPVDQSQGRLGEPRRGYNVVVVAATADLSVLAGSVDHGTVAGRATGDVASGNSHPAWMYRPALGDRLHGGSGAHEAFQVDVYWDAAPRPLMRTYALFDVQP